MKHPFLEEDGFYAVPHKEVRVGLYLKVSLGHFNEEVYEDGMSVAFDAISAEAYNKVVDIIIEPDSGERYDRVLAILEVLKNDL